MGDLDRTRIRRWGARRERQRPVPTCYIHIGTHKTGSTAIQNFLFANRTALADANILVPASGRLAESAIGCGHHCIAWDALGAAPNAPVDGSIEQLVEEIRTAGLPIVCISSEEFAHLYRVPNNMQRLRAGLHGIGYRAVIVVYLRPQADYLEALYAEVARHAPVRDFWECYREVLAHGAVKFWHESQFPAAYDYDGILLRPFRRIFGARNVIVRPFRRFAVRDALIRDFMQVVCSAPYLADIADAPLANNSRPGFAGVTAAIARNRSGNEKRAHAAPRGDAPLGPFEVLRPHEIARLCWHFARSNFALLLRYRVWLGVVSAARLRASLTGMDRLDARVRFLRSVFEEAPDSAGVEDCHRDPVAL